VVGLGTCTVSSPLQPVLPCRVEYLDRKFRQITASVIQRGPVEVCRPIDRIVPVKARR